MRRTSLLLVVFVLSAAAIALGTAALFGPRAHAAIATPVRSEPTFTRVRMVTVHRQGFQTLVVQPEYELTGIAAGEVTVDEAASEFSKKYAEPFRGPVGMCNIRYGDRPAKVMVERGKEETEAAVTAEGMSEHAVLCVKTAFQLSSYEDVLSDPDDVEVTFTITPNPAARPQRLAWVIPVPSEPLAFGKAPASIFDDVARATDALLPAAPIGDVIPGLPPATPTPVPSGSITRVPGKGGAAIDALQRMLAEGDFGALPTADLDKYRTEGDWTFIVVKDPAPPPLVGALEPIVVTFRSDTLTIPMRIFGSAGVRDTQVWVFSDRIIPPAALRSHGLTFAGRFLENGREDGVDYKAENVPAALKTVLETAGRVAPPLAPLARQGATYRLDGIPIAVQPNVWSSECRLQFATFSSPRAMPDYARADAGLGATKSDGCGGCRTSPRAPYVGAIAPALAALAALAVARGRRRS